MWVKGVRKRGGRKGRGGGRAAKGPLKPGDYRGGSFAAGKDADALPSRSPTPTCLVSIMDICLRRYPPTVWASKGRGASVHVPAGPWRAAAVTPSGPGNRLGLGHAGGAGRGSGRAPHRICCCPAWEARPSSAGGPRRPQAESVEPRGCDSPRRGSVSPRPCGDPRRA